MLKKNKRGPYAVCPIKNETIIRDANMFRGGKERNFWESGRSAAAAKVGGKSVKQAGAVVHPAGMRHVPINTPSLRGR